jgi:hypothetical protein
MSLISSGIGIHFSALTSCCISPIGNIGVKASGPMGSLVAGFKGGSGLLGISAIILYHFSGMSFSDNNIFRSFIIISFSFLKNSISNQVFEGAEDIKINKWMQGLTIFQKNIPYTKLNFPDWE